MTGLRNGLVAVGGAVEAMRSREPSSTERGLVVFACFFCQLGLGYTYLFSAILPEATAELGWTRAEFSSGRWPYFAMTALGGLAAGQWTVRYGARPVLVTGALALAGALALLSRVQDLATFWLAQALYGVFMAGLGDIAIAGVLTSWVRGRRGAAMGFVYAASNLSGLAMPSLFSRGVGAFGWRATLLWMGIAGAAAILPFAWVAGRRAPGAPSESRSEATAAAPPLGAPSESRSEATAAAPPPRALALDEALRTRSFWLLAFTIFGFFFVFLGINDAFVSFLRDLGMTRDEATGYYGLATGAGGLSKLLAGMLGDRLPAKTALALDHALLALAALLLLALPSRALFFPFLAAYGFAIAARDVVYPLALSHCFGERTMPAIYGAVMMSLCVAAPLGSQVTSAVRDATGSYTPAFAGFAVLSVAMLAALSFVRREVAQSSGENLRPAKGATTGA
jgi:sugar phosphate permease